MKTAENPPMPYSVYGFIGIPILRAFGGTSWRSSRHSSVSDVGRNGHATAFHRSFADLYSNIKTLMRRDCQTRTTGLFIRKSKTRFKLLLLDKSRMKHLNGCYGILKNDVATKGGGFICMTVIEIHRRTSSNH